jgi:DNA-binding response OmpR family regulator
MGKQFSGRNILVVEDEMLILLFLEEIMIENGCASVKLASSVPKALELINANSFDAATLDLNLNGIKSFPVADALEARGVPFVFMTGNSVGLLQGRYCGHPILQKPFKASALVAALNQMMSE